MAHIVGPEVKGNKVICKVVSDLGIVLHIEEESVDSSAGLGGYDLGELQEARKTTERACQAFLAGHRK